LAFLQKNLSMI